jgi:glycosyltransferase involved in cell wall biosynthesis
VGVLRHALAHRRHGAGRRVELPAGPAASPDAASNHVRIRRAAIIVARLSLVDRQIVCVGFADWDAELWTNQHHLMARLAQRNHVLFVESLGLRRPQLSGRDLARTARRLQRASAIRKADGLHVLSPVVVPLHNRPRVRRFNAALLRAQVGRAVRRLGFAHPLLWSYVPQADWLIDALAPTAVVYHCVDDIAQQKGVAAAAFRATEERFAAQADLVLASSPALAERLRSLSEHVLYAPNVADTALFARALDQGPCDQVLTALPRPRVVFTGAVVATKLDLALLAATARARPGWTFALVGPVGPGDPRTDVSALRGLPNVHLPGARAYEDLPAVLRTADAAIVPYAVNALTRSIFPMKIYEYLAAGLPVVSTPLPALAAVEDVMVAHGPEAMVAALDQALATDSPDARRQRSERARAHSWDARLEEIDSYLSCLGRT